MKSIVTIDKDILLKNGTRIPISRRKKNDVLQAYIKFDTHYNQCHLDKVFYDENSISYAVMH